MQTIHKTTGRNTKHFLVKFVLLRGSLYLAIGELSKVQIKTLSSTAQIGR